MRLLHCLCMNRNQATKPPRLSSSSRAQTLQVAADFSELALYPKHRIARAVVRTLDIPVLAQWIVIHGRDEIEGRLEFNVVEA